MLHEPKRIRIVAGVIALAGMAMISNAAGAREQNSGGARHESVAHVAWKTSDDDRQHRRTIHPSSRRRHGPVACRRGDVSTADAACLNQEQLWLVLFALLHEHKGRMGRAED